MPTVPTYKVKGECADCDSIISALPTGDALTVANMMDIRTRIKEHVEVTRTREFALWACRPDVMDATFTPGGVMDQVTAQIHSTERECLCVVCVVVKEKAVIVTVKGDER